MALQPGQAPPGLGLERVVALFVVPSRCDEPIPFDRRQPGDGLRGLGDLLVDPVQCPPVSLVAVVDDLAAPFNFGSAGQGWVKTCQSGIFSPGCSRRIARGRRDVGGSSCPR